MISVLLIATMMSPGVERIRECRAAMAAEIMMTGNEKEATERYMECLKNG